MAELSAAAPARGAAFEPDVLLATKLHVPRLQQGFVARLRLVEALDEGLSRRLILVCAPAGFGKTALLADWAQRGSRPVAWLSLDAGDNDPARFWRHAVAALDRVRPGIGERAGPLLGPPAPLSFEGLVTALINQLAAQPGEDKLLLVLDDYHLIDTQQVQDSLAFLLEHLPSSMHLVLASRPDPPLPLARLRARGQLAELRAAELRFTADEAAALLREAVGGDLPGTIVGALAARTEGWAAGLQLAALSLRGQQDKAGLVAAFSGSHRYVLDYLADEVLERQDEQLRGFLLETSVLDRLSSALCDAVTGRTGSQAMLERVERAGLFMVPLDVVRGWWRYHHLFADLLGARLRREQPGRVEALHRAAAAWCEEHDLADDAVRHALAAGDPAWAARLIERYFDAVFLPGERATVQRWQAALPGELVRSRPRLGLAQMWMAVLSGHIEAAGIALEAAERASADAAEEPFEPSVGRAASLLANVPAAIAAGKAWLAYLCGDADAAATFASQAHSKLDEGESMLNSVCQLELALADWLRGRLDDAERGFAASIVGWRAAGQRGLAAAVCNLLGHVQLAQGRLDAVLLPIRRRWRSPRRPASRRCPLRASRTQAWRRWNTSGANSRPPCGMPPRGSPGSGRSTTPRRSPPAPPWRGSGRPKVMLPGRSKRLVKPSGSHQDSPLQTFPILCPRSGRGCCWLRVTPLRLLAGPSSAASARMMTRATRGSRSIWCWPGCCSPRMTLPRRWRCSTGCMPWRPARGVPEVSSRSRRCGRWPWPPRVTRTPRWMPWPRRSCSAAPRVMSGCSPTRGRRWPR